MDRIGFDNFQRKKYFYIEQYRSVCGRSGIAFFTGGVASGKRHLQCLFPAETSALRGCFLTLNGSKKKHPQTPSDANARMEGLQVLSLF